jgi:hypothetical protein
MPVRANSPAYPSGSSPVYIVGIHYGYPIEDKLENERELMMGFKVVQRPEYRAGIDRGA